MIKKILIIAALILACFISIAQVNKYNKSYKSIVEGVYSNEYKTLVDRSGLVYDWGLYGNTCYGCPSFYIKIMRDAKPTDGKYVYYVFFFSNSYNLYGYLAGTYIKGVNISKINELGYFENIMYMDYLLVNPKTAYFDGVNLGATFYSKYPNDPVTVTWESCVVY